MKQHSGMIFNGRRRLYTENQYVSYVGKDFKKTYWEMNIT